MPSRAEADETAAHELYLYAKNDADLNRQQGEPIIKNLMRKRAAGTYDHDKAAKVYLYMMDNAARKYETGKEGSWTAVHGYQRNPIPSYFNKPTRELAAKEARDDFEAEANTGNYDKFIPKKYRKGHGPVRGMFRDTSPSDRVR